MSKKTIIILSFILMMINISIKGRTLDLDISTSVDLALANNLQIKIEKTTLDQSKWALCTSWNSFSPTASLNFNLSKYHPQVIENAKDSIDQEYEDLGVPLPEDRYDSVVTGNVYMSFELSFRFNVQMIFGINQSIINWRQNKISLEMVKKQVTRDVKGYYYHLLLLEENINLIRLNIQDAKSRFDLAKRKYDNEIISELELLSTEYTYENLKTQLVDMNNKYQDVKSLFKQLLGIKQEVPIQLMGQLDMMDSYGINKDQLKESVNDNLEVKLYLENLKSLINQRNIHISQLTPTFSLSYLFDMTYQENDPFDKENKWFSNREEDWKQKSGYLTLILSIPVSTFLPFSNEQMGIVNKSLEIKKEKLKIEKTVMDKENQLNEYIRKLKNYDTEYQSLLLNLQIAEKVYTLAKASYEAGIKNLYEVENSEEKLNNAKLKLLKVKYYYILKLLDLELLLNQTIIL
ncbi:MAG: TolC family protein [Spirochaetes bacterium]|nr:TolC family protein [Spirochaetota bacterium]